MLKHVSSERFFEFLHINEKIIYGCLDNGWVRWCFYTKVMAKDI